MKAGCVVRHRSATASDCDCDCDDPYSGGVILLDCAGASLCWTAIQVAFALLTENTTEFIVCEAWRDLLQQSLLDIDDGSWGQSITFSVAAATTGSVVGAATRKACLRFSPGHLLHHEGTGEVLIPSIAPSLDQLLCKEAQSLHYLQDKYGSGVQELMDEFDLLPDEARDQLVHDRSAYLLDTVRQSSPYYARTLASNDLNDAPVITGRTLLEVNNPMIILDLDLILTLLTSALRV
mmetsp:Transcript_33579/g.62652  ORF Transcript_33579/g.62652 Transcript_33579/m.62652 type:complete len:236 (-) Transcript_33579:549-1256(-)